MDCPKCQQFLRDSARFCDRCGARVTGGRANADGEAGGGGAETLRDPDPLLGQTLDSKYELIRRLGEGGMGAVYRGRRVHIGDEVAVKVLLRQFVADSASAERFRREARAAAVLRHANVVSIYDYGEARGDDAPAYIVMELLEGLSLRALLQQEGRLQPSRAVLLMGDICAGVGAAHRRGVFHRDLKPDNVIVLPPDEDRANETVKVVDFGIAKLRDVAGGPSLTQTGAVVGSPFYMSPEQCRGEPLDARSDVYSLGAMLFEMLAGTPPFTAETITGVIAKHLFEPPPPLPPRLAVPSAIEEVIMRALAKDPAERQPNASALAHELREAEGRARAEEQQRRHAEEERLRREEEETQRAEDERLRKEVESLRTAEAERQRADGERDAREAAARAAEEQRQREAEAQAAAEQMRRDAAERLRQAEESTRRAEEAERRSLFGHVSKDADKGDDTPPPEEPPPAQRATPHWLRNRRVLYLAVPLVLIGIGVGALMWGFKRPAPVGRASGPTPDAPRPTPAATATPAGAVDPVPPEGMVYVAGGVFMMGRDDGADEFERPAHKVPVAPFFIDKYEVTNDDYLKLHPRDPARKHNRQPVTGLNWYLASDTCKALGKRLPTEEEWEFAARGTDGRRFPWGNDWQKGLANANHDEGAPRALAEVGTFGGASPFGVFDMVGNAWEWTASSVTLYPGSSLKKPPAGDFRVIRGGSYVEDVEATTTYRGYLIASGGEYDKTGFRCAKSVEGAGAPAR